jgi:hypothetical protein
MEESASPDPYGTGEGNCNNGLALNRGDASEAVLLLQGGVMLDVCVVCIWIQLRIVLIDSMNNDSTV